VTSLFGRAFRKPPQPAPQPSPEMPPRPAPYRSLGPDTTPKLALGLGPVDPDWDPCGRPYPPLKTGSDEGEAA
jgi:hypothetical protein